MQTFLPYPSYIDSALCLDYRRLGKQRVEAYQILQCLLIEPTRWKNHPAVKMWQGYESSLCQYTLCMIHVWKEKGYKDTLQDKIMTLMRKAVSQGQSFDKPIWISNNAFHRSHRSNLVRKYPEHYRKFFPDVPDNLPYIWPV